MHDYRILLRQKGVEFHAILPGSQPGWIVERLASTLFDSPF
jgi:hypothetical protein